MPLFSMQSNSRRATRYCSGGSRCGHPYNGGPVVCGSCFVLCLKLVGSGDSRVTSRYAQSISVHFAARVAMKNEVVCSFTDAILMERRSFGTISRLRLMSISRPRLCKKSAPIFGRDMSAISNVYVRVRLSPKYIWSVLGP